MPKVKIFIEDKKIQKQVEYTFKTLFNIIGLTDHEFVNDAGRADIYYGAAQPSRSEKHIWLIPAGKFWSNYGTAEAVPQKIYYSRRNIPCIYAENGDSSSGAIIDQDQADKNTIDQDQVRADIDIIASSFFMLR